MEPARDREDNETEASYVAFDERPYDGFAYDVVPGEFSAGSQHSIRSQASRSSDTSTVRLADPTPEDYDIRSEDVTIEKKLGEGYFGEVFQGSWLGQPIAAKILKGNHTSQEAEEEFVRETSLLNKLRHPNVIVFYGVCTTPDLRRMIVSELLHSSLFTFIHSGNPVPDSLWVRIARDIAAGLSYLHSRSPPIVHRDLSSSNVLLTADVDVLVRNASNSRYPVAKISDFGLSRAMEWYMTQRTGNMFYMAVEVFQGEHYTEKADVYSLGITMSEMFTRTRPYGGLNPHKAAFQAASIGLRPALPSNMLPVLKNLIERCWAQAPAERPSSSDVLYVLQQNMHLAEVTVEPTPDDALESVSIDEMSMTGHETFTTESLTPEEVAMQLIHCIQDNDLDAVGRMLSMSAVDVNTKVPAEANKAPLHFATTPEMTRLLCDHGAQPYLVDDTGDTALHTFYRLGLSSCIQVLLTNGCRDDMRNNDGLLPRECLDVSSALDRIGRSRAADDMRWLISQEVLLCASSEQLMQYLDQLAKVKSWNVFAILLETYREPAISFNGFDLQRDGFLAIVEVLKRKRFRKIDLVNNKLLTTRDPQGLVIRKLISLIRATASTLVELDIRENGIGDEMLLVEPIKECSALRCLNGNMLSVSVPYRVLNFMFVRPSSTVERELRAELMRLEARMAEISGTGRSLPHALFIETKDNGARQREIRFEIDAAASRARSEPLATYEVAFITRRVATMQNLQVVSFANIRLPSAAIRDIAEVLVPVPIEELILMGCGMDDESLGHVAEALARGNAQLRALHVGYNNEITKAGLRQLMDVVRTNTCLRRLQLSATGSQERDDLELAAIISEPLLQNRTLREIATTDYSIAPKMIRGDLHGKHVFVDREKGAFPMTYELLLPFNRTSTDFTFVNTIHPGVLRAIRNHPALRTLSIEMGVIEDAAFEALLEVLPTLRQLQHLSLTGGNKQQQVYVSRRPGLDAAMLRRLMETLQAAALPLRHLRFDRLPLLHGRRVPLAVGNRVSVLSATGDRVNVVADTQGTIVDVDLGGANRFIRIRTDGGVIVEYDNCCRPEDQRNGERAIAVPYHEVDLGGLEALRQLILADNSQLSRVWIWDVVTYELPPQVDVAQIVTATAESCPDCVFYLQRSGEPELVIGQRRVPPQDSNNVAIGDQITVGKYQFNDGQLNEWFLEGVVTELPAPTRSEPITVIDVDLNWDGTLRVDGQFADGARWLNALAPPSYNGRPTYPHTLFRSAELEQDDQGRQRIAETQAADADAALSRPESPTPAVELEEQKQAVDEHAPPARLAAPAPPVTAAACAPTTPARRFCDSPAPPHQPLTFNIQLCHHCFIARGTNCLRCGDRIFGQSEPAVGCPQCNRNRQKCAICGNFVGQQGRAALSCQKCTRRSGHQKLCSWRK